MRKFKMALGLLTLLVGVRLQADMEVTFKNATTEYAFYFLEDLSIKIGPGETHTFTMADQQSILIGMDYSLKPSTFKKYGLGIGKLTYKERNGHEDSSTLCFELSPYDNHFQPNQPIFVQLSGGVIGRGQYNFFEPVSLKPNGTNGATSVEFIQHQLNFEL